MSLTHSHRKLLDKLFKTFNNIHGGRRIQTQPLIIQGDHFKYRVTLGSRYRYSVSSEIYSREGSCLASQPLIHVVEQMRKHIDDTPELCYAPNSTHVPSDAELETYLVKCVRQGLSRTFGRRDALLAVQIALAEGQLDNDDMKITFKGDDIHFDDDGRPYQPLPTPSNERMRRKLETLQT